MISIAVEMIEYKHSSKSQRLYYYPKIQSIGECTKKDQLHGDQATKANCAESDFETTMLWPVTMRKLTSC